MICTQTLVAQKASIMHVKVKINIVVCCQFDMDFPPISKDFGSRGMTASRAAHFPHILRASRQITILRPVVEQPL